MEPKDSPPCSKQPVPYSHPVPDESSLQFLILLFKIYCNIMQTASVV